MLGHRDSQERGRKVLEEIADSQRLGKYPFLDWSRGQFLFSQFIAPINGSPRVLSDFLLQALSGIFPAGIR